jgi:hypothetical protein
VRKVLLRIAGDYLDLALGQKRRHWRVNVRVGAGDVKALVAHSGSDRGHGRSADANKMNRLYFRHRQHGLIVGQFGCSGKKEVLPVLFGIADFWRISLNG